MIFISNVHVVGNLTKHMRSKAHYRRCLELNIIPVPSTVDDSQIDMEILASQQKLSRESKIKVSKSLCTKLCYGSRNYPRLDIGMERLINGIYLLCSLFSALQIASCPLPSQRVMSDLLLNSISDSCIVLILLKRIIEDKMI